MKKIIILLLISVVFVSGCTSSPIREQINFNSNESLSSQYFNYFDESNILHRDAISKINHVIIKRNDAIDSLNKGDLSNDHIYDVVNTTLDFCSDSLNYISYVNEFHNWTENNREALGKELIVEYGFTSSEVNKIIDLNNELMIQLADFCEHFTIVWIPELEDAKEKQDKFGIITNLEKANLLE